MSLLGDAMRDPEVQTNFRSTLAEVRRVVAELFPVVIKYSDRGGKIELSASFFQQLSSCRPNTEYFEASVTIIVTDREVRVFIKMLLRTASRTLFPLRMTRLDWATGAIKEFSDGISTDITATPRLHLSEPLFFGGVAGFTLTVEEPHGNGLAASACCI